MEKFNSVQELILTIDSNTPTKRYEFLMMMLGFYPSYFNFDYYDNRSKKYGVDLPQLKVKENASLIYLKVERLLSQKNIPKDFYPYLIEIKKKFNQGYYYSILKYVHDFGKTGERSLYQLIDEYELYDSTWDYFRSNTIDAQTINGGEIRKNNVKYRLYVSIDLDVRAYFSKLFINQCIVRNLPYCFKVLSIVGQTDTVVIYIDTKEHMLEYANIITELFEKNSIFRKKCSPTSPYLCKINQYLGFGFEPGLINGERESYTSFMKKAVESIKEEFLELRRNIIADFKNPEMRIQFCKTKSKEFSVPSEKEFDYISHLIDDEESKINNNSFINPNYGSEYGKELYEFFEKYKDFMLSNYKMKFIYLLMKVEQSVKDLKNNKDKKKAM